MERETNQNSHKTQNNEGALVLENLKVQHKSLTNQ